MGLLLDTLGLLLYDLGYMRVTLESLRPNFEIYIFLVDSNNFMHQWCQFDIALEALFIKIMEDNGRKVKHVPQEWHIDVEWHLQCILYRLVSDPDGPINRKYTFSRHILRVQEGPGDASRTKE